MKAPVRLSVLRTGRAAWRRGRGRLLLGLMHLLARLPLRMNHAVGAGIGWLFWRFPNRLRQVTTANLALCFPEQSPQWRRRVARASLLHLGRALTEAPWLWSASPQRLRSLTHYPEHSDPRRVRPANQALFILTPHLGAWEFVGLHLASHAPMTSLYSPLRSPQVDAWVRNARESTGACLVPANWNGLRALKQARDAGGMLGILPDQNPKEGAGVFAPFFGQPALSMTLLARLLEKRNDRVVVLFAERLPKGQGFRYHELEAGPQLLHADRLQTTTRMNGLVEQLVRICPEQYNWAYKRFHPAPPGYPDPYRTGR